MILARLLSCQQSRKPVYISATTPMQLAQLSDIALAVALHLANNQV